MNRLPRLSALTVLLVVAAAPPAISAADQALLGLADPASNFVIGIDVQALSASPLAREALSTAQTEYSPWGRALGALGPNPLSRIQEVLITGDLEAAREEKMGLVLIKGDFSGDDWMSFACQAGCSSESYRGFTVQGLESADKPSAFVRLDASYVALGSPDQVRGVVDRRASGSGSSFAGRVQGWISNAEGHHVWIAAKGPFDVPHGGEIPMGMSGIANLDAFSMGLTLREDLEVGLELRSMSAAESVALHQSLQGLLMMLSLNARQDPDTAELLRGLTMGQSAQTVSASVRVPGYLLKRMAEKRGRQAANDTAANWQLEPSQPAPSPSQPRQGIIRIEGLENGPVVVESEPRRYGLPAGNPLGRQHGQDLGAQAGHEQRVRLFPTANRRDGESRLEAGSTLVDDVLGKGSSFTIAGETPSSAASAGSERPERSKRRRRRQAGRSEDPC